MDTILIDACARGDENAVKRLMKDGFPVHIDNNKAFRTACYNGHLSIVQLLLKDDDVDPTDHHMESFQLADEQDHFDIILFLLTDKRIQYELSVNDCFKHSINKAFCSCMNYMIPLYTLSFREKSKLCVNTISIIYTYLFPFSFNEINEFGTFIECKQNKNNNKRMKLK